MLIAALAAFATLLIAVLTLRDSALDRAALDLDARMSVLWTSEHAYDRVSMTVNVVNRGRRPVRIVRVYVEIPVDLQLVQERLQWGPITSIEAGVSLFVATDRQDAVKLEEKQAYTFRLEPFPPFWVGKLDSEALAYVEDTAGQRFLTTFYVGPDVRQVAQERNRLEEGTLAEGEQQGPRRAESFLKPVGRKDRLKPQSPRRGTRTHRKWE